MAHKLAILMNGILRTGVAWAVLGLTTLALVQPAGAMTEAERSKAREHFSIGVELLDETPPKYHDALLQFRSAYSLSGSWKVLGNMGLCAHKLERDGEAVKYYRLYLQKGGEEVSAAERRDIDRDLLAIQAGLARVKITADVADAKITVTRTEGSAGGQAYYLTKHKATLGLRAGTYRMEARAGSKVSSWSVVLRPKERASHRFFLKQAGTAAGATPTSGAALATASPSERMGERNMQADAGSASSSDALLWTGVAAVVVGGLGVGGSVFWGLDLQQQSNNLAATEACTALTACARDSLSKFEQGEDWILWGSVGFGAVAALGAGMVVWSLAADNENSALLLPVLTPKTAGVLLQGSF